MSTFNIIINTADSTSPEQSFSLSLENCSIKKTNSWPASPNFKKKEIKSAGEKKLMMIAKKDSGELPAKSKGTTVAQ